MPIHAQPGDVLVLTKPLGTQVAVNLQQWRDKQTPMWDKCQQDPNVAMTVEEARCAFATAQRSMSTLNREGAILMHKYGAHCATDVTGFGLFGHAENLASNQTAPVHFRIHTLPVIRGMAAVNKHVCDFCLTEGISAETSGGLLVALPSLEAAQGFLADLRASEQHPADWGWVIGEVLAPPVAAVAAYESAASDAMRKRKAKALRSATIDENPTIIDV
jgi:selenide,water dikinase